MLLNCGVGEDSCESLGLQGDQTSQSYRKSVLNIYWKDWCWSWSSNTLATWCEKLTHWKRPRCLERLKAAEEGDDRDEMFGWHHRLNGHESEQALEVGEWTGKPGMLQSMGSQGTGHDWLTELNRYLHHLLLPFGYINMKNIMQMKLQKINFSNWRTFNNLY